MKVLCVTYDYFGKYSSFSASKMITIGEWYEVVEEHNGHYTIIWNNGYKANLAKDYFKTVSQIRQEKLDQLDITN